MEQVEKPGHPLFYLRRDDHRRKESRPPLVVPAPICLASDLLQVCAVIGPALLGNLGLRMYRTLLCLPECLLPISARRPGPWPSLFVPRRRHGKTSIRNDDSYAANDRLRRVTA